MSNRLKVYIGVDPGAKGYFCLLAPSTKQIAFLSNIEQPHIIYQWLKTIESSYNLVVIMIENVHSIFGSSAKSNFEFGRNVGIINAVSLVTGNSVELVTPKVWQKFVGVKKKGKEIKKEVAFICNRLYPKAPIYGPKGGLQDGKSDALMIAHYASQTFKT